MKLTAQNISPFITASIFAGNGEYDYIIDDCVKGIGEELNIADLEKSVLQEMENASKLDEDAFNEYLAKCAKNIKEKEALLMICLNILASDLVITVNEMANFYTFAEILGISDDKASEIFDDFVDEMEDLVIEDEN